jgi:hypothetical protein
MQKKQNNNFKNRKFIFKKRNSLHLKKNIEKKEQQIKINNQNRYLYKNKKLKKGIFLKKPKFNEILYPFFLNLKLVNEYLKKN